jgi:hypothetical protein
VPGTAQAGIVSFQSVIKWNVVAEYEPGAFRFGPWFGPTSPVDTFGAPDQIMEYVSLHASRMARRAGARGRGR